MSVSIISSQHHNCAVHLWDQDTSVIARDAITASRHHAAVPDHNPREQPTVYHIRAIEDGAIGHSAVAELAGHLDPPVYRQRAYIHHTEALQCLS